MNEKAGPAKHWMTEMSERGFVSVFEYVQKSFSGGIVWTLWTGTRSEAGNDILTAVDGKGNVSYYDVVPNLGMGLDNPAAERTWGMRLGNTFLETKLEQPRIYGHDGAEIKSKKIGR